jgi:hypothetical protein
MLAAREWKDVYDLPSKRHEILIEGQYLNYGFKKLIYTEGMDILVQCIASNLFP